jgi:hypothetical protein
MWWYAFVSLQSSQRAMPEQLQSNDAFLAESVPSTSNIDPLSSSTAPDAQQKAAPAASR